MFWSHNSHKCALPGNPANLPMGVTIGDPKGTSTFSVEKLKKMGAVGIYTEKKPDTKMLQLLPLI